MSIQMPQERRELTVCLHQSGLWAAYIRCEYDIRYDGFTQPEVFAVITEPKNKRRRIDINLSEHPHLEAIIAGIDWREVFEVQVIDEKFKKTYDRHTRKTGQHHR